MTSPTLVRKMSVLISAVCAAAPLTCTSGCTTDGTNSAETGTETVTLTATPPSTDVEPPESPQPTTPTDSSAVVEAAELTPRYVRHDLASFASAYQPGQVSFSSVEGAIECEFRRVEGNRR